MPKITAVRVGDRAMGDSVVLSPDGGGVDYTCPDGAKCAVAGAASSIYVTLTDATGCSRTGKVAITGLVPLGTVDVEVSLTISTPQSCPVSAGGWIVVAE